MGDSGEDQPAAERPRIGLVLGGGGARGFAHIGVLRVLEEANVPVDLVVGTSMGAVVGGLYAAGRSPDEIANAARTIDWNEAFNDRGPRDAVSMRRKADGRRIASDFSIGISLRGIELPRGAIQGQQLTQLLRRELGRAGSIEHFDNLGVPFRPVAIDLESGEVVTPASGDLALAIRASMSIPGVVAPVDWDGRLLVDGGVRRNLPVEIARDMGADIIIAVDVGNVTADELSSAFQVMDQALRVMIRQNVSASREEMTRDDIYVRVDMAGIGATDFDRSGVAIAAGERAAQARLARLEKLALADPAHAAHVAELRAAPPADAPIIRRIELDNRSDLSDDVIRAHLDIEPGERLDRTQLERTIDRIHGLGYFERVDYRVTNRADGMADLELVAEPQSWGPNYLRFGLVLEDDFDTRSTFRASASYLRTEVNAMGAEFQADLVLGDEPRLGAEFWQPLGAGSPWFIAPMAETERTDVILFNEGERLGEVRLTERKLGLAGGRSFGPRAEVRFGLEAGHAETRDLFDTVGREDREDTTASFLASATWDTFNDPVLPSSGTNIELKWQRNSGSLGADRPYTRMTLEAGRAFALGRNRWILSARAGTTADTDDPPVESLHRLGGFLNLGGFRRDELTGTDTALAQLIYVRNVAGYRAIGGLPLFLGGALESGNAWDEGEDQRLSDSITAGTLFAATETPLGPVFIAYAINDDDTDSAYLSLGRTF